MELAKTLIRSVARAFYETQHILVVDALLVHSALRDDDLAHLLGMQVKELRKLCAKLDEHRLLSVHSRQETREGMPRPISKTYYYIDFRQTIDAIKYRIYRVTKEVEASIRPTDERKDYYCPRCGSRWTQMEVLDSIGLNGFNCHKCGASLERDDEHLADGGGGGHEKQSKLMKQLEPLLALLPRIDEVVIPDNTFEAAFNAAIPIQRNQTTNPINATIPVDSSTNRAPATVKGLTQLAPQKIEVALTSSEAKTAAEQAAENERKARVAEQNALPVWHTNSTVTGEKTALGNREEAARRERDAVLGTTVGLGGSDATTTDDKKVGMANTTTTTAAAAEAGEINDEVAQYYAQLAQDQAKARLKAEEEDEEDDEEDEDEEEEEEEDEFEDVPTTAAAAAITRLATSNGATNTKPSITVNGASTSPSPSPSKPATTKMKRVPSLDGSDTSSSVPTASGTGISSPAVPTPTTAAVALTSTMAVHEGEEEEERSAAKRARTDDGGDAARDDDNAKQVQQQPQQEEDDEDDDDDDDEDEVEFEDV